MIHSITAQKDATVYNASSSLNTGRDEVLEVSKTIPASGSAASLSRSLIKFDLDKLPISSSGVFYKLRLWATEPEGLQLDYDVQIGAVSQSWSMGAGKLNNTPITTEGVSWDFRTGKLTNDSWESGSNYGPTLLSGMNASQSFHYTGSDVEADVTSIVSQWKTGTYPNEGFLLKFTDAQEADLVSYGILKFFSTETNTIYKPRLFSLWVDAVYTGSNVTGSLTVDDISVYPKGIRSEYNYNTLETINVVGRPKYPIKTFSVSQSAAATVGLLPSSSYYAVQDKYTGEFIVPFSDFTKLSCDGTKNYFVFDFSNLTRNRLYTFIFKVVRVSQTQFFFNDNVFKVV